MATRILVIDPSVEMVVETTVVGDVEDWALERLGGPVKLLTSHTLPGHRLFVRSEPFPFAPTLGFLLDGHFSAFLGGGIVVGWNLEPSQIAQATLQACDLDSLIDWWSRLPREPNRWHS